MLFPRFSIRSLIALTFVAALCAFSVARATQGDKWAVAVAITIGTVGACMVIFGFLFAASWAFGSIVSLAFAGPRGRGAIAGGPFANQGTAGGGMSRSSSPFAEANRFPPQVIPDNEPPPD